MGIGFSLRERFPNPNVKVVHVSCSTRPFHFFVNIIKVESLFWISPRLAFSIKLVKPGLYTRHWSFFERPHSPSFFLRNRTIKFLRRIDSVRAKQDSRVRFEIAQKFLATISRNEA